MANGQTTHTHTHTHTQRYPSDASPIGIFFIFDLFMPAISLSFKSRSVSVPASGDCASPTLQPREKINIVARVAYGRVAAPL